MGFKPVIIARKLISGENNCPTTPDTILVYDSLGDLFEGICISRGINCKDCNFKDVCEINSFKERK